MSWTKPFDEDELLKHHDLVCAEMYLRLCVQAHKAGNDYDLNLIDTYVDEFFNGIQPTPDEFMAFLERRGIDAGLIEKTHTEFLQSLEEIKTSKIQSREKAESFFRLFQTEWHVLQADVSKYIDEDSIYFLIELAVADAASTKARLSAVRRHQEDPKQREKATVRECWGEWQKQPGRYTGKASFARDMLSKFENLSSQPVIERWCREWEAEIRTQQAE